MVRWRIRAGIMMIIESEERREDRMNDTKVNSSIKYFCDD